MEMDDGFKDWLGSRHARTAGDGLRKYADDKLLQALLGVARTSSDPRCTAAAARYDATRQFAQGLREGSLHA